MRRPLPSVVTVLLTVTAAFASPSVETPVIEVVSFDALLHGHAVSLNWTTASPLRDTGFTVEHAPPGESFVELGYAEESGTTDQGFNYRFEIAFVDAGYHRFRLKQASPDGGFAYSSVLEVSVGLPDDYLLSDPYPNPFNPRTSFELTTRRTQQVEIDLLNSMGRHEASIFAGQVQAGVRRSFSVSADRLSSGVYFYRVVGEDFVATRIAVLLK